MNYIEAFVCAVPGPNKDAYREHAAEAAPLFREFGARRLVECWGDDVPVGKINDFRTAVQAKEDETIVFSWLEYPDQETRNSANQKLREDPRMKAMGEAMPFDGKRMIFGGFAPIIDIGDGGKPGYTDAFVAAVPSANREAYAAMVEDTSRLFCEHGATRVVEAWGDDLPDGEITDFAKAAHAREGESIVSGWIEWPSKAIRDEGWEKVMADERMHQAHADQLFDGKRMIYGGFVPILDA